MTQHDPPAGQDRGAPPPGSSPWLRNVAALAALAVAVYVALSPTVVYTPQARVVLYVLVAMLPAIVIGAEASSRFKMELPKFLFTTGGAAAFMLGLLVLMDHLARPEVQISVYRVDDEQGRPVNLERAGAFEVMPGRSGLQVTAFVRGNQLALIFPEQLAETTLSVRPVSQERPYQGAVGYAGSRQVDLRLGRDLKQEGP